MKEEDLEEDMAEGVVEDLEVMVVKEEVDLEGMEAVEVVSEEVMGVVEVVNMAVNQNNIHAGKMYQKL